MKVQSLLDEQINRIRSAEKVKGRAHLSVMFDHAATFVVSIVGIDGAKRALQLLESSSEVPSTATLIDGSSIRVQTRPDAGEEDLLIVVWFNGLAIQSGDLIHYTMESGTGSTLKIKRWDDDGNVIVSHNPPMITDHNEHTTPLE